jgi:predicted DNA repair protein MutK
MAAATLLALLDDIASLLDDVAGMSNLAAKKTAGILGDDLALNAQRVAGVRAARELPVVWAVAKGSVRNKLILVPGALVVSYLMPWLISPLLMAGGAYLCFEGFEAILERLHARHAEAKSTAPEVSASAVPVEINEEEQIAGAIRTDLILSAEIIVITLGTVATAPLLQKAMVLSVVAALMTVVVYGLVAGILKLDDLGLHWLSKTGPSAYERLLRTLGANILAFAPWLMRSLAIVGTAAMFMVGGGIIAHAIAPVQKFLVLLNTLTADLALLGGVLSALAPLLVDAIIGVAVGALSVAVFQMTNTLLGRKP